MKSQMFFRVVMAATVAYVLAGGVLGNADEDQKPTQLRWDIIKITFLAPSPTTRTIIVDPGGTATATARPFAGARDHSKILLTGSGFLFTNAPEKGPRFGFSPRATGGGTWETFDPSGKSTGQGDYRVVSLDRFVPVPGELPCVFTTPTGITVTEIDNIGEGDCQDIRGGFAIFRIEYSDGDRGFLTVSCRLNTSPGTALEAVTVTRGFVDYIFNPAAALLYHVVPKQDDE